MRPAAVAVAAWTIALYPISVVVCRNGKPDGIVSQRTGPQSAAGRNWHRLSGHSGARAGSRRPLGSRLATGRCAAIDADGHDGVPKSGARPLVSPQSSAAGRVASPDDPLPGWLFHGCFHRIGKPVAFHRATVGRLLHSVVAAPDRYVVLVTDADPPGSAARQRGTRPVR